MSGDAGTPSSTRSWVSRSSDFYWSAAPISSWPTALILTSHSRARKLSCKVQATAIFATGDREIRIDRLDPVLKTTHAFSRRRFLGESKPTCTGLRLLRAPALEVCFSLDCSGL